MSPQQKQVAMQHTEYHWSSTYIAAMIVLCDETKIMRKNVHFWILVEDIPFYSLFIYILF